MPLIVYMLFTKDDKILVKNLFKLKGYNAKHLVRKFPNTYWNVGLVYKLQITVSVDNELVLHKNGQVRNNICILYIYNFIVYKNIKIG